MTSNRYDAREYRLRRISEAQGTFNWNRAGVTDMTLEDRNTWQTEFRLAVSSALGGLHNWEIPSLDVEVTDVRQLDGYRREFVSFTTRPGLRACGYFLVPDNYELGNTAMLCLPGHGRGIDTCIGIAPDGSQRPLGESDEYSADFALQWVAHGYPTLALESIGFGLRRDSDIQEAGVEQTSCVRDSMAALMLGETLAGWRVWDAMRGIDFLQAQTDYVNPDYVSVNGISGGGMIALFLATLDIRVRIAFVSCYFNTFADSVLAVDHCVDNFVPGLLNICEMPDLAALIPPRALVVEGGLADPIFPHDGFVQATAQATEIFEVFGFKGMFEAQEYEGGHQFYGTRVFDKVRENRERYGSRNPQ